jgi:hypothetical protein
LAGLLLVLTYATVGSALAACGIGSTIWEGHDSTAARAAALTTNVFTFYGISTTFEIAGCTEKDNIFKRAKRATQYARNNLDHLAEEMARGEGEHLDAFAHLLDLEETDRAEFKALSQANFERLFPRDDVTADEFLAELADRMAESPTLLRYLER